MPRKQRSLVDQGMYHIYNRGNHRLWIYKDQEDFEVFYALLLQGREDTQAAIFHYCLMSNHFHLLVKLQKAHDLPVFMHQVQGAYVRHYKKKYGVVGHLFQGRYKSPLIEEEAYYLHCGRYIERNPVKAHLVAHPTDYRWSSAAYYGLGRKDALVTESLLYRELGNTLQERKKQYRVFLTRHDPYEAVVDRIFF